MIHVEVNRAVMGTTDKQLPSRHRRELKTDSIIIMRQRDSLPSPILSCGGVVAL